MEFLGISRMKGNRYQAVLLAWTQSREFGSARFFAVTDASNFDSLFASSSIRTEFCGITVLPLSGY